MLLFLFPAQTHVTSAEVNLLSCDQKNVGFPVTPTTRDYNNDEPVTFNV